MRLVLTESGGGTCDMRLLVLLFLGNDTLSEANRGTGCDGKVDSSGREPGGVRLSAVKSACIAGAKCPESMRR